MQFLITVLTYTDLFENLKKTLISQKSSEVLEIKPKTLGEIGSLKGD